LSVRRRTGVFVRVASGLFWVGFVELALEGVLVASANVTIRLLKARTKGCFSCRK
jgi:hypothetical protein